MRCWRRMERIRWTDHVKDEVLRRVEEKRNILNTIKRRKSKWIAHSLPGKCLLKHVTEGKREGMRRRGIRHTQTVDYLKEQRRYYKLKEEH